jgi:hypothetical protein
MLMDDAPRASRRCAFHAALAILALVLGACESTTTPRTGDPLTDIRNPDLKTAERIRAAELAWDEAERGVADREETRKALKDISWPSNIVPEQLRLAIIKLLMSDPSGEADSRNFARLTLPQEPKVSIVTYLSNEAAQRGWEELTPSLIRSYARPSIDIPDGDRPEKAALEALHPDKSVAEVAFEIFLDPPVADGPYAEDDRRFLREDAWDLLTRIDSDGSFRAAILETTVRPTGRFREEEPIGVSLAACVEDFRLLPKTGRELSWLKRMRDGMRADAFARQWWTQATEAVALIKDEDVPDLRLRHIEPIRWAAANRSQWLGATRAELYAELHTRLDKRPFNRRARAREGGPLRYERLDEWAPRLSRLDLIAILVIDEALSEDRIQREIYRQVDLDHADKTTEYGGVLNPIRDDPSAYRALLYPPRPMARVSDKNFTAPRDMIEQSDRSLAHYHFHVNRWTNAAFAGPSHDDLTYANSYSRQCLVFTALGEDEIAVDYYQPCGLVIDLGEIARPSGGS